MVGGGVDVVVGVGVVTVGAETNPQPPAGAVVGVPPAALATGRRTPGEGLRKEERRNGELELALELGSSEAWRRGEPTAAATEAAAAAVAAAVTVTVTAVAVAVAVAPVALDAPVGGTGDDDVRPAAPEDEEDEDGPQLAAEALACVATSHCGVRVEGGGASRRSNRTISSSCTHTKQKVRDSEVPQEKVAKSPQSVSCAEQ